FDAVLNAEPRAERPGQARVGIVGAHVPAEMLVVRAVVVVDLILRAEQAAKDRLAIFCMTAMRQVFIGRTKALRRFDLDGEKIALAAVFEMAVPDRQQQLDLRKPIEQRNTRPLAEREQQVADCSAAI